MFAAAAVMNGARTGRNHRLAHYIRDHIRDTYLARRACGTLPSNARSLSEVLRQDEARGRRDAENAR